MSILESMRSGTDSPIMQVIFGAVVVSFVFLDGCVRRPDRDRRDRQRRGHQLFAYGRAVGQEETGSPVALPSR